MIDDTPNEYSTVRKRLLMHTVLRLCRELRTNKGANKYRVFRGAVNWAAHDFEAYPVAISVHCDDTSFLRGEGNNEAAISLEMMMKMPESAEGIDDDVMDDITDDAAQVFEKLELERDPEDSSLPVIVRLDRARDTAIEVSDPSMGVQGVVATTFVQF